MLLYVSTQEELLDLVTCLQGAPLLAIDTEFHREKTYYAKLCLIQVATDDIEAIIDPLNVDDLSVLSGILVDPDTIKVFHAGEQDRAILFHECGVIPFPVFDTQVAASLLGYPQQIGYGPLVSAMCDVQLSKADSFTDWTRRPLSSAQIAYALDDVHYLPGMCRRMIEELSTSGRLAWLDHDFARMSDPSAYEVAPEERWRKVKRASSLSRRQLASVREIAAWRERAAQKRNIPRKWVLTDEMLVEIAKREPDTREKLFEVRGAREKLGDTGANEVIEAIARALDSPQESWPARQCRRHKESDFDGPIDLMMALVHLRARENNVTAPLLASRNELVRVAAGEREDVSVLTGWRLTLVGKELLSLLEGKLWLSLEDGVLKVTERGQ